MNFKFFSALALLSVVAAQSDLSSSTPSASDTGSMAVPSGATPSGGPGPAIPSCVETCISQSGCDPTDVNCLCVTNVQTLTDCVTTTCSPEDQSAAASLQQSLCASASGMSGAMSSTMITGSATTQDMNSTSSAPTSSSVPVTRTTPSPTLTPRPISSNTPTTASTSAAANTSTNAAAPQNIVAQGVWVMVASLIGLAVAA